MPRRFVFILVSIVSAFLFVAIQFAVQILEIPVAAVLILFMVWLLGVQVVILFSLGREYKFPEQIMFLIIPLLLAFVLMQGWYSLSSPFDTVLTLPRVGLVLVYAAVQYLLLLTLNIINAATVRTVPLLKAAQITLLCIVSSLGVAWGIVLLTLPVSVVQIVWLWFLFTFLSSLSVIYFAQIEVVREFTSVLRIPITEALMIAFLGSYAIVISAVWEIESIVRVIYWIVGFVVPLLLVRSNKQKSLSQRQVRDYTMVVFVVYIMVTVSGLR